tara:strand:+ start:1329 stop:1772 length:444 start_codon:yes stop_codon:yes gene_type:complete
LRVLDKLNWHHKNPFIEEFRVTKEDIDILGHVNNKVYLNWCETVSWNHSASLGITSKTYEELKCACVVIKSENYFMGSLFEDDSVAASTWIISTDKKIRLSRFFQIINIEEEQTIFTSNVDYACVSLDNFKPTRMPQLFRENYKVSC